MHEMAKKRESTPGDNLTKQIIEQYHPEKGSVLFIDEAYSLVDDRNGSFGDEASGNGKPSGRCCRYIRRVS